MVIFHSYVSLPEANNQSNFLQWHLFRNGLCGAVPCVQGRKNPRILGTVPLSFWSLEYIWPICPNNILTIEPIYIYMYVYIYIYITNES